MAVLPEIAQPDRKVRLEYMRASEGEEEGIGGRMHSRIHSINCHLFLILFIIIIL
jgi:hypothetical protein